MAHFSYMVTGGNTNTMTLDFKTMPNKSKADIGATLVNMRVWGIR